MVHVSCISRRFILFALHLVWLDSFQEALRVAVWVAARRPPDHSLAIESSAKLPGC